jgi:hypothetical protein
MKLEGHYARIVATLSSGGALPEADKDWLRLFICIQMQRTEHAINKIREWTDSMASTVYRNHPEQKPIDTQTDAHLMRLSMQGGIKAFEYAKDLKVVIFKNITKVDFVTCDHPAVMTNRYHHQRLTDNKFGVSNSGAILLMPLSPALCAVCYDGGVYSIANASGTPFVCLTSDSDVRAVNELQYLNVGQNVYLSRWGDRNVVAFEANRVAEERSKAKPAATIFVRDYSSPSKELYRKGTPEEEAASREEVVATSFQHPRPSSWPSQIRFRNKPKMFSNGSAAGYVRKPEWLTSKRA